ncbi:M20/M25/M40 family metallo-hydrolase [Sphingomonas montanisoli]|uniref:M20/M25/M40 family metallo-hydrolase n=1 Tax=Sphingomonas montanisoli TaxID=2606412 RepID=A0A5D9C4S2_9SPHN|nr:M20/M25/M40 family metallo-hydrolase [Sphingomonas montanisoli]TZG24975.1 M20/M25/M40 family metallo-hydrolase [Sphingomonas montanisoli]
MSRLRTIVTALLMTSGSAAAAADLRPDQTAFRALFEEMVNTDTSATTGSCTLASERLLARMRAGGFKAGEADLFVPEGKPKDGGVIARITGTDPKAKAILLVDHIDVVAAKREDWSRDPFTLGEEDGFFIGRGVIDDKALVAIWADMLIRMKGEGFRPRRTIKFAATCGEESGLATNGVKWLIANKREAVDAGFALNEGGHGLADKDGKPIAMLLAVGEKHSQTFTIEARNPGGHSSRPRADNAIYDLADALEKIRAFQFPVTPSPVVTAYLQRMGPVIGGAKGTAMTAFAAGTADADQQQLVFGDAMLNAMLRTTCVATTFDAGHAVNALPQRARSTIQCRLLPGDTTANVQKALTALLPEGVALLPPEKDGDPTAIAPPLTPAILGPAEAVAKAHFPGVPVVPNLLTAGTDGRYLSAAGIPTYGVPGIAIDADGNGAHGLNERVRVRSVYAGRDYLYDLVKRYAR